MKFDARTQRVIRWLWVAALLTVVVGSLLPGDSKPMLALDWLGINDKIEHSSAYFALAFLALTGFERRNKAVAIALSMVLLGIALELLQHFSPGRTPDVYDALANGCGVAIGTIAGSIARAKAFR